MQKSTSILFPPVTPQPLQVLFIALPLHLDAVFLFIRVRVRIVPEHHPMLLATNRVVEFSRLSWLSHDAMIRTGIMARGPQPTRPPVAPNPSWVSLEGYDWATCAIIMAWLSFGCNQFMITGMTLPRGHSKRTQESSKAASEA